MRHTHLRACSTWRAHLRALSYVSFYRSLLLVTFHIYKSPLTYVASLRARSTLDVAGTFKGSGESQKVFGSSFLNFSFNAGDGRIATTVGVCVCVCVCVCMCMCVCVHVHACACAMVVRCMIQRSYREANLCL